MKRIKLRSKLTKIISNLDEIIRSETEQTHGLTKVKKCRDELQQVLVALSTRKKGVSAAQVIPGILKLVDCVYFFMFGRK